MGPLSLPQRLIDTALAMNAQGLNVGKAGNLSARTPAGFLITPTGVPYEDLQPEDLVAMDVGGRILGGRLKPSSEWPMHRAVYAARPDAGAVLHAHPPHATGLACARRAIPPFHYMVAVAGGRDIRCAPYHLFGSEALAEAVLEALAERRACLLANHGLIALGADPGAALALALEVENLARQYLLAEAAGGAVLLSEAEIDEALARFDSYGRQDAVELSSGRGTLSGPTPQED